MKTMKRLWMIGGPMGVGKTTVCGILKKRLDNCVFLDGDWCWDSDPFIVTPKAKKMVIENIGFMLNNFIDCGEYENIVFCWVMHVQEIIDDILSRLDISECDVLNFSLICDEDVLKKRLYADIEAGKRTPDVIQRSLERLAGYAALRTVKIDTSDMDAQEVAEILMQTKET